MSWYGKCRESFRMFELLSLQLVVLKVFCSFHSFLRVFGLFVSSRPCFVTGISCAQVYCEKWNGALQCAAGFFGFLISCVFVILREKWWRDKVRGVKVGLPWFNYCRWRYLMQLRIHALTICINESSFKFVLKRSIFVHTAGSKNEMVEDTFPP